MVVLHVMKVAGLAGAERAVVGLLGGLRRRGIEARLIILEEPRAKLHPVLRAASDQHVPVERVPMRGHLDFTVLRSLERHFRRALPDVVHTHMIHADAYGVVAARRVGVPAIVLTRHDALGFRRRGWSRRLNRWLLQRVDVALAVSESVARFLVDVEGARPTQVRVVHNGIEVMSRPEVRSHPAAALHPEGTLALGAAPVSGIRTALERAHGIPVDAPLVGVAARLVEAKGVQDGLRAFGIVAEQAPTAWMAIAGDGPMRPPLERLAHEVGVADRVCFLGWRDDVAALLDAFDVVLVPSLQEGFGMTVVEAAAAAVPVVATEVGGIPEIVESGETGLLVPPGATDEMASALTRLLRDAALRERMGRRARERFVGRFSLDQMVEATMVVYQDVCGGGAYADREVKV